MTTKNLSPRFFSLFFTFALFTLPGFECTPFAHADESAPANRGTFPLPFTGRLYTDQYFYTEGPQRGDPDQSSVSAWLEYSNEIDHGAAQGLGVKAVGQVDYFVKSLDGEKDETVKVHLREGYVSSVTNGSDLRIGQQIIPWGKSDGVNPTDYFTAKDYTILNPDDEVRRFGAPGVNFNFTPQSGNSPISLQFVAQAFYPQTQLLIPDQVIPTGIAFQKYPDSPGAFTSNSLEYGAKISYLKSSYDFSLSAYRGFAHMPEYIFDPAAGKIYPINPRETSLGTDASFTSGNYIFRLESAFHLTEGGTSADPMFGLVQPRHWDSVIGVERPVFTDFRIQLQILYRYQLDFQDPSAYHNANPQAQALEQAIGRANAIILNYLNQSNLGATFRVSYNNDDSKWGGDIFFIGYVTGDDYLIRPQVSYKPLDDFKLMAGVDLYGGSPDQPLGALKNDSDVFLEAKYLF